MNFQHDSELAVNTRGVALSHDGVDSIIGMFGTTCRVAVRDASIGADYDFPTETEVVNDNSQMFGENAVLVVSDYGAHVTFPDRTWDFSTQDYGDPGTLEGRIWSDGVVLLSDTADAGCQLKWSDGTHVSSVSLSAGMCASPSLTVDHATGTAYVADGSDVVTASPDGATLIAHNADMVVWDDDAQVLYTAQKGDSMLYGLEPDGSLRWSADLGDSITSFDAMGGLDQSAVMLANRGGTGSLVTVDAFSGEVTSSLTTPAAANQVVLSDNGRSMALVLPGDVHFFSVKALSF